jgi:hypothetical protein
VKTLEGSFMFIRQTTVPYQPSDEVELYEMEALFQNQNSNSSVSHSFQHQGGAGGSVLNLFVLVADNKLGRLTTIFSFRASVIFGGMARGRIRNASFSSELTNVPNKLRVFVTGLV